MGSAAQLFEPFLLGLVELERANALRHFGACRLEGRVTRGLAAADRENGNAIAVRKRLADLVDART